MADILFEKYKLDSEFQRLTYPLSIKQYTDYEMLIKKAGCPKEIYTWNNTIISEYDLFYLCKKHSAYPKILHIFATSREEVIDWICRNELQRPDLPNNMWKYLIGRLYIAEKILGMHAASQVRMLTNSSKKNVSREPRYEERVTILRERIGNMYNISQATVSKYEIFTQAIDVIYGVLPEFSQKALANELKISQESIVALSRLPIKEMQNRVTDIVNNGYLYSRTAFDCNAYVKEETNALPKTIADGSVKNMPVYDPDAEIVSLSLTIPSWISSINRVMNVTDVSKVSASAKNRLKKELNKINETVMDMLKATEDN